MPKFYIQLAYECLCFARVARLDGDHAVAVVHTLSASAYRARAVRYRETYGV